MNVLSETSAPDGAQTQIPGADTRPERHAAPARAIDSAYTDFTGEAPRRAIRVPVWILCLVALLAGMAIGGWVIHRHDRDLEMVASVNGQVVNKDAFFHRLQIADGPGVLRQMVAEDLQLQFAKQQGVAPTKQQIDARYEEASGRPGFQDYLSAHGLTSADYKRTLSVQLAQINVATKGIDVTDAEVRRFYQVNIDKRNQQAQFFVPETTQVEVIVTSNRAQADQAYQELAQFVPFDVVARKYSVDSASANGGMLPPLQRGRTKFNNMPGLENAVFSLKIGDQTSPMEFGRQWWIIRCLDKIPETTLPFSEVKEDCVLGAKMQKAIPLRGKQVQKEFVQFQRQSQLQAFWPQYQSAVSTQ